MINDIIKKARLESGLTQQEVADKTMVTRAYYADVERGRYCGKMAGYNIEVNNLSDGQVFTYRAASNSWRNEDKGVVGAGKALAIYDGETLLFEYSGDAPQSFDTEKTAIKGDINELQGDITGIQGNVNPFLRQPSTFYALGTVVYLPSIGADLYLECTTPGTTDSGDLVISMPISNNTVTDGTVVWTIRNIKSDGFKVGDMKEVAYNGPIEDGWLLCDGSAISRTTYAELFAKIGTAYGVGDGTTTFNIPNRIDKFAEGSATAGTEKQAGLPNIKGRIDQPGIYQTGLVIDGAFYRNGVGGGSAASTSGTTNRVEFDASRSSAIYSDSVTTVQPAALTCRVLIKYE